MLDNAFLVHAPGFKTPEERDRGKKPAKVRTNKKKRKEKYKRKKRKIKYKRRKRLLRRGTGGRSQTRQKY